MRYNPPSNTAPGQGAWLVVLGIVVFIIVAVVVAVQPVVGAGVVMIGASVLMLAASAVVLWGRRRTGALLLALDTATPWHGQPWLWYSMGALLGIEALINVVTRRDLPWLIVGVCWVIYALVMAQRRQCLEVREDGLFLAANGYTRWSRVIGYILDGTTLTVRIRPISGLPSWTARVELRCSSAERQALRQELDRHLPAAPHEAMPTGV